jgi:hypothetical protein
MYTFMVNNERPVVVARMQGGTVHGGAASDGLVLVTREREMILRTEASALPPRWGNYARRLSKLNRPTASDD